MELMCGWMGEWEVGVEGGCGGPGEDMAHGVR